MLKKISQIKSNQIVFLILFCVFSVGLSSNAVSKLKKTDPLPANLFVELNKKVNPSVVNISTEIVPHLRNPRYRDPMLDLLEQLWGQDFNQQFQLPQQRPNALGTGFIIREDGLIITNNHVISNADVVKVQLTEKDDTFYEAEIVGRDQRSDIALIKITVNKKLNKLTLGSSKDLEVGEWVAAFGNPFGHGHTMTKGIISAKERSIDEINKFPFLQTDASINPGNSGGPLVNVHGEVIGVNTAIDARAQGIGFAIPIDHVKSILEDLEKHGQLKRGYFGVGLSDLSMRAARHLGLPKPEGSLITQVESNSPADKAGLKPYDVVVEFNKKKITNSDELARAVSDTPIGKEVNIEIFRKKQKKTLKIKVGTHPESVAKTQKSKNKPYSRQEAPYKIGFKVTEITKKMAENYNIPNQLIGHSVVLDVTPQSPAAQSGITVGDVVLEVNSKSVQAPDSVIKALKKGTNTLRLLRGGKYLVVFIEGNL